MQSLLATSPAKNRSSLSFCSAKTRGSIRANGQALLDFLVCASLDPEVVWLAPADPVLVRVAGERIRHQPDLLVGRRDGEVMVDVRSRTEAKKALYGAVENALAAQGLRYEIRQSANLGLIARARQIWSYRDTIVTAGQQFRVLQHLNNVGLAPLRVIEDILKDAPDPRAAAFALICFDILEVDILLALSGDTPLRRRRPVTPVPDVTTRAQ